ncbi:MAG: hypothetical protein IJQ31_14875 [Thermoguttaceae bacterium]|nr:hypothetical protein [Thermoguttaceae bacterium]
MICKFIHLHGEYYKCEVCGLQIRTLDPSKIFSSCPGKPRQKQPPGLLRKAAHYAEAVTRHVTTGMETRTDEEVINILQICEMCDQYTEDHRCAVCGCNLSTAKSAFSNKLRMKTEHCPRGLWE